MGTGNAWLTRRGREELSVMFSDAAGFMQHQKVLKLHCIKPGLLS